MLINYLPCIVKYRFNLVNVTVTQPFIFCPYWESEGASHNIISLFSDIHGQTRMEIFSVGDKK